MSLTFDQPVLLGLLVPALAIVFLLWRTSRAYLPPLRRWASLIVRSLVVSLLLVALAGPHLTRSADTLAVAVLLDRSDSISPADQDQEQQWLSHLLASKRPDDQVAVVSFAGQAEVDRPLSADPSMPTFGDTTSLHPSRTNIASAIRLGLAALPPSAARRLVLLSDGNENDEQATSAAALAAAAGVPIDTVALPGPAGPSAVVEALDAPSHVRQTDQFAVTVQVRATQAMPATLYLAENDHLLAQQAVNLQPGANRFPLSVGPLPAGQHVLELQMDAPADAITQNKSAGALVTVDGPPRILVVEGSPGDGQLLASALQTAGLQVDLISAQHGLASGADLNSYASVVLANVPASALSDDQQQTLQTYVQTHGGGLVVTGGDQAYGPGGYARTTLENMLPVSMDLRGSSLSSSTGLVLAIDTSGSMGQDVGGTTIMDLAKQAAVAAAQALGPQDEIGVISLVDHSTWALQPTPASNLDTITTAINGMAPGGGDDTNANGISMGTQGLAGLRAAVKDIVLITDGENPGGDYQSALQQAKAAGITVSTIGIGSQADTQLLQQTAQLGGGSYYDGSDPFNLPQLVVKETQQLRRAAIVEQAVPPAPVDPSSILAGIDPQQLPQLRGYVATTPKPQSTVALASPQSDPLLAYWQFGLGRVVAWTSDVTNRWSAPWLNWPGFAQFWAQVVNFTVRPPEDPDRQLTVSLSGDQAQLTLDARTGVEQGTPSYLNFLPTTADVTAPGDATQHVQLPQVAPGEYQATVPAEATGVYTVQATQTNADGSTTSLSSGFVVPYSPEYRELETNADFLGALATQTSGQRIQTPDQALQHDLPAAATSQPLWPSLLVLAAALFVADVALRRLRLRALSPRTTLRALRTRLRIQPEPPLPSLPRRPRPHTQPVPLVGAPVAPTRLPTAPPTHDRPRTPRSRPPATSTPQRLLEAKRRATQR